MTEFVQTIWNSFTTENPDFINKISFPFILLDAYVVMLLFITILNIQTTRKQRIIYVFTFSTIGFIFRTFIPNPYGMLLNFALLPSCVIFIFKTGFLKAIFAEIIPTAVSLILETIFEKIFFVITNIEITTLYNIPIYRFSIVLLVYLCIFIMYKLFKHFKLSIAIIDNVSNKTKRLLIINSILGLFIIISEFYLLSTYTYNFPIIMTILNTVILVIFFFISGLNLVNTSRLSTPTTNLEAAEQYNKTLEILHDTTRAFRHDRANLLQGMSGFIDNNDMEGLKKYYYQMVEDIQHFNNLSTLSPKVVNNPAIYNVLASKYHKADELGIKINLEAFLDLNDLHMKIYDFTRVLGILMDNAIEAASECEEKIINVTFRKDSRKHMQLLIVENTYNNKEINTDEIFEKGFSTKEGNTGLGLWEIRQILKKNNNLNLYTTKNDKFFNQQFEIYY